MKKIVFLFVPILLLLFNFSCEEAEIHEINVDAEIAKQIVDNNIPSVVACIVNRDGISWTGNYGYANLEKSTPANNETIYSLQSITKLFIAVAVMQLWENGQIDLEADINNYLPFELRNPYFPEKKITTEMLLTHTSGLAWPEDKDGIPDFHHFYTNEEPPLISDWLPDYILPTGNQYRTTVWKNYAPGEMYLYSNIATSLLALIVEQISEMDFRDYCRVTILTPLEMNNSAFRLTDLNPDLLVTPYTGYNRPMEYFTCRHYPAGFLSTNVLDFANFAQAFLNYGEFKGKHILQKNTVLKMFKVQNTASGHAYLWLNCLGDCIGKKGGGTGFSTWAEWHLENGTALFLFSNKLNEAVWPTGSIYELVKYKCYNP